jgi:hypothetical protein
MMAQAKRDNMQNDGWVVVVMENEHRNFVGEVAYIKGPFETHEEAEDWANTAKDCEDGLCQITFLEHPGPTFAATGAGDEQATRS